VSLPIFGSSRSDRSGSTERKKLRISMYCSGTSVPPWAGHSTKYLFTDAARVALANKAYVI
jgi:hypothetical protein